MSAELPVIEKRTPPFSPVGFDEKLAEHHLQLRARTVATLQVNVGKLCNQACKHCHVDASPNRTEIMTRATAELVIAAVRRFTISTLDITGGAPELNSSFRYLVTEARKAGARVIVRHNLTVMFEPGQEDLPEFFRDYRVEVVSSLPYFLEQQTDSQRGRGVFRKSLDALSRLNVVGYGTDPNLVLNLVYNPVGAFLPPSQESLERDFKRELLSRYGISFNNLYAITNMPISRYLDYLRRSGNEERYMTKLVSAFNPSVVEGLMCRDMISIGWTGRLYDCDFNQMLDIGIEAEVGTTIEDFDPAVLSQRRIATRPHCFGCTAGTGSSCGGSVAR